MKRVVLVAPEFPPANTAGAHRPRLFAKHLPAFDWTPTVITIRRDRIEGPQDALLESLLAADLEIIRTNALPVHPVRFIGDVGIRALMGHGRALASLARQGRAQAVVLFGPPWFSFLLGPLVCQRCAVPYVIDYIDPWISDWTNTHRFPSRGWWYQWAAAIVEPQALRSAAHVTAVSAGILEDLRRRYPWLPPERLSAMPYGADPDDLEVSARLGLMPPDFTPASDTFNISFTGALQPHGGMLLRGVLMAVRALRDGGTPLGRAIRLHFYGTSNLTWGEGRYAVLPLARELGVSDLVSEIPERIPYLEAMAVLRACDVVLVMGSTDQYYHASKLYPAIVSGKPVLAICHEGSSIRTVMQETGAGRVVPLTDGVEEAGLVSTICEAIEALASHRPPPPTPRAVEPFTARASTAVLAAALDQIAGASRALDHTGRTRYQEAS